MYTEIRKCCSKRRSFLRRARTYAWIKSSQLHRANDLIAQLHQQPSGAHIVLFTTGRGTPFASPVPTVKISSNSTLAGKKKNWIDFNAGVLVEDAELEETGQKLFDYVIDVASGKKVRSEEAGFHDMAIFKQGVTL